mmetsp:Transcript_14383/g.44128  ORF Transcript_14383/g.44128 Transcript_14383/m.44128 type:complete len:157 (-) Transcript_14383:1154-1624(-)
MFFLSTIYLTNGLQMGDESHTFKGERRALCTAFGFSTPSHTASATGPSSGHWCGWYIFLSCITPHCSIFPSPLIFPSQPRFGSPHSLKMSECRESAPAQSVELFSQHLYLLGLHFDKRVQLSLHVHFLEPLGFVVASAFVLRLHIVYHLTLHHRPL